MNQQPAVTIGQPYPLGVSLHAGGLNIAVVSRHAERIYFCVFDDVGDREQIRIPLPGRHGDVHHGFIEGFGAGTHYGVRAEGPWDPASGHRFDPSKLLVDPYAVALDRPFQWHHALAAERSAKQDTAPWVPRAIVPPPLEPVHPLRPHRPEFIYEVAVKSFTKLHPAVPEAQRGTVAALAHPDIIRHFKLLGVDTIELMPIAAWIDERHLQPLNLANAWGYNPVAFMAPDPRLAPGGLAEIRSTVAALHSEGLRVVLDAVFNHTGESDIGGATLSLRGLDNALYFRHAADHGGTLVNDSGCGNTLALDRVPVVQLVMDALRHWVLAAGVDGFRFDLASILGRTALGFTPDAPLLAAIEQDPLLSTRILIAEPWDVGLGGYRLGGFPPRWQEWNDRYRDDVRRFWRGDADMIGAVATRLAGSSDIFRGGHRRPSCSINFLAAHDGFTLHDLVSYHRKHNEPNGENNRDGKGHEVAWNHGHEGPTADTAISDQRRDDVRALIATLLFSRGTPMLTAGDDFGRTQHGNNNAYAQDNPAYWLDWNRADTSLVQFVGRLANLRRKHPALSADNFLAGESDTPGEIPDAQWLMENGQPMSGSEWSNATRHHIGLALSTTNDRVVIWLNASNRPISVTLPPARDGFAWKVEICSAQISDERLLPPRSVTLYAEVPALQPGHRATASEDLLTALARQAGIGTDWWDADGTYHTVPIDTLRSLLSGMQIPCNSMADVRDALQDFSRQRMQRALPRSVVAKAEQEALLQRGGAPDGMQRHTVLHVAAHRGQPTLRLEFAPGAPLRLPPLPAGYHDAWLEDAPGERCRLIVTPGRCYVPGEIERGAKWFGLASHLYALRHRGDHGIGDFGTLSRFAEAAGNLGGALAGINPLHHLFPTDRERVSPYQPSDRRFVDPIYIDLTQLLADGPFERARRLAESQSTTFETLSAKRFVDHPGVWAAKNIVLEAAFAEFMAHGSHPSFDAFIEQGGAELERHGVFEALAALHGTVDRASWPEDHRYAEGAAIKRFAQSHRTSVLYRAWLQWVADRQLAQSAQCGRQAGAKLGLFRGLAAGAAFDGGETWANPDLFVMNASLGASPDRFARNGQIWYLPPFSPHALEASGYEPFIKMMAANMAHTGVLRIDHILSFARQFWIPHNAGVSQGAYVDFQTEKLIAITAIESQRHRCAIIGEDLGTVPDGLRNALDAAHILSDRVLWFERNGTEFKPSSAYPRLAASCLGRHDLPTFAGWLNGRDIEIEQELGILTGDAAITARVEGRKAEHAALLAQLQAAHIEIGTGVDAECEAAHEFVAQAPSALMLVQVDDLIGETEPLSVPGSDTGRPNWRRRLGLPIEDLADHKPAQHLLERVRRARAKGTETDTP